MTQENAETGGMSVPTGTLFALDSRSLDVVGALNITTPSGMAIDSESSTIYVSNSWNSSVYIVDGQTMQVVREIALSGEPGILDVDEGTGRHFITLPTSNAVSMLDLDPARVPEFPALIAFVAAVGGLAALIALRSHSRKTRYF
jgi:YVTN family beta-propeller protein